MFAAPSLEDLIAGSDLIVLGRVAGYVRVAVDDTNLRAGDIVVSELLAPSTAPDPLLLWLPQPGGLRASTDIDYPVGSDGLWFLRRVSGGLYAADHPQRFVPRAKAGTTLAKTRVLLGA